MSRHNIGCEHSMTICNHVHYNSRRPPYCHDRSTQPQPRHDRELRRRTKANPGWNSVKIQTAGFNPIGEHLFFLVCIQIRSTTRWIPACTILRDFTWKTPIYQSKDAWQWAMFIKISLKNLWGMNSVSFLLSCAYTNRKFQIQNLTWVQTRYVLQGFDGPCLIHHNHLEFLQTQKNLFIIVNPMHLGLFFRDTLLGDVGSE